MLASERQTIIYNIVRRDGAVKTSDLKSILKVSEMTIRRDIEALEFRKLVQRVRGGAVAVGNTAGNMPFAIQSGIHLAKKLDIARTAAELVRDGMHIAVDGSSTGLESARLLKSFKDITLVTNNISLLWEFRNLPAIRVVILGGEIASDGNSIDGSFAIENAVQLFPDIFFFSCAGFDTDNITTATPIAVEIRKILLRNSKKNILLADSSKFGKKGFVRLFDWSNVNVLITNPDLSEQARDSILGNAPHLEIILAESSTAPNKG